MHAVQVQVCNCSMRGARLHAISICLFLGLSLTFPRLAFSQSRVRYLPGFPGPLPFHLETGYIGVGESDTHKLFYYFLESERNPKEDPLVLWLTGGPGCSAWSGLLYEIGPLYFEYAHYDGSLPRLKLREYSWTKISNIIFVDSPVPTGFSYFSNNSETYVGNDLKSPKEIYQFLVKWFTAHPQFLSNPLYIGGDSYNGLILPPVVYYVANGIEAGKEPILNLKGYFLGNPKTHRPIDDGSFVPFVHRMNLISDELYESVQKSCGGVYWHPTDPKCIKDIEAVNAIIAGIDVEHILEPLCPFVSPKPPLEEPGRLLNDNLMGPHLPHTLPGFGCREYWYLLAYYWANDANVRKALHVSEEKGVWIRCDYQTPYNRNQNSTLTYHLDLTARGYRALVYSGDHDMIVPTVGTEQWIKSLNFSIVDDWRPWMVDGQVAGYTRGYSNNFTFATVKGAGHTAPEYKPKECFEMFKRWISNKPL